MGIMNTIFGNVSEMDIASLHKISGISAELQQINATGFDN